ncbi:MAG TPA: alanine racemase [Elusimicrobia bacterium]|nr:alanine racemase [Elusimicrobiota bacterium]
MKNKKQLLFRRSEIVCQGSAEPWRGHSDGGSFYRPTWAEINLQNLKQNIKSISGLVKPRAKILAVVKANAYGHMALPCAKAALAAGASALGVSSIEEGITLRRGGIKAPILILGSIFPFVNLSLAVKNNLTPTISSLQGLAELARIGARLGKRLPFHLKVDTGMGRVGLTPSSAISAIEKAAARKEVSLEGIYTHFSSSLDREFTDLQLEKFLAVTNFAKKLKLKFTAHAANSGALLTNKKTHLDMVRPGLAVYGLLPFETEKQKINLSPVLSWKTRVVFMKRVPAKTPISYDRTFVTGRSSLIATLPVGYADGYLRSLSNKAEALINGRRCPVVGRVTMDMIMVDVTKAGGVSIGAEAVLLGAQGSDNISVEEMARWANTINYEIACGISARVPRVIV